MAEVVLFTDLDLNVVIPKKSIWVDEPLTWFLGPERVYLTWFHDFSTSVKVCNRVSLFLLFLHEIATL